MVQKDDNLPDHKQYPLQKHAVTHSPSHHPPPPKKRKKNQNIFMFSSYFKLYHNEISPLSPFHFQKPADYHNANSTFVAYNIIHIGI